METFSGDWNLPRNRISNPGRRWNLPSCRGTNSPRPRTEWQGPGMGRNDDGYYGKEGRRTRDAGSQPQEGQFLAMLAHELRNPLAPVRNAIEITRSNKTDTT